MGSLGARIFVFHQSCVEDCCTAHVRKCGCADLLWVCLCVPIIVQERADRYAHQRNEERGACKPDVITRMMWINGTIVRRVNDDCGPGKFWTWVWVGKLWAQGKGCRRFSSGPRQGAWAWARAWAEAGIWIRARQGMGLAGFGPGRAWAWRMQGSSSSSSSSSSNSLG